MKLASFAPYIFLLDFSPSTFGCSIPFTSSSNNLIFYPVSWNFFNNSQSDLSDLDKNFPSNLESIIELKSLDLQSISQLFEEPWKPVLVTNFSILTMDLPFGVFLNRY